MTWKKTKDIVWFVFIWVLAVNLIEYQADSLVVETAGDLFGALALMFIALMWKEEDTLTN